MPSRLRALVLMALAAASCTAPPLRQPPVAKGGVMDLSTWNFERDGSVPLRGEWVLRYGELLGPSILGPGQTAAPPMIIVPGPWSDVVIRGQRLAGEGFATQALRLILPPTTERLGLAFGEAYSAERLWVNGLLTMERGRVGTSRSTEVADVQGRIVPVNGLSGTADLAIEISNHFHSRGGPVHAITLGPRDMLRRNAEMNARLDFFLIGCLLVLGLFYAALSLSRPDLEIILFALLTLLLALRTATLAWYITAILPLGSEGQLRLDYVTFIVLPLIFAALIAELFRADVPRIVPRLAFWYGALALIGPLALDTQTFTSLRNLNIAMGAAFAAAAVLSLARAAYLGRRGASPLLLCGLAVLAVGFRDAAMTLRVIPESRALLPFANTVLVFAHAVVLGRRISDTLRASEGLSASLQESNALLERRIAERTQELEKVAMTDALTGLLNRRPLMKLAEAERARAARSKQRIGVMMIDCDDFKIVNDRHGHDAGDRVLRALSQRFATLVRSHDLLGRWGGEEFVMIFSTTDAAGAEAAAERLRQHVAALPFDVSPDVSLHLTVTVGVAVLEDGMESFEDLLRRADQALYAAKASGKNRIHMAPGEDPGTIGTTTRG